MTCREFESDLTALEAGELDAARAAAVEAHLAACAHCRASREEIQSVRSLLDGLPSIEPSAGASARRRSLARRLAVGSRRPARRSRGGVPVLDTLAGSAALGFEFLRFRLGRSRRLRVLGAIAAALVVHASVFAIIRTTSSPGRADRVAVDAGSLPPHRPAVEIIGTLDDAGAAEEIFEKSFDLHDPDVFGSFRDSVGRQVEPWNSRSIFRLDAAVRLDPAARRRIFAALGDPDAIERGIARGLDFLAAEISSGSPLPGGDALVASLSTLAFLGGGSSDAYGAHAEACGRAAGRLLAAGGPELVTETADLSTEALLLWALAENSALSPARTGATRIGESVAFLARAQKADGGWPRFLADETSDERSSAVVASALAIAARSGFAVPASLFESYAGRFAHPRLAAEGTRTDDDPVAVASMSLSLALIRPVDGRFSLPAEAADRLEALLSDPARRERPDLWLWERGLLAIQVGRAGDGPADLHRAVARRILEAQAADGSVDPGRLQSAPAAGRPAATALALLVLEVPCRYRSKL